ncbi:MAG: glycosyltransferase [Bryobacteraceae bacterium]|nr:glycosyltransferase [Bryobacteraceae bacterium]
MDPFRIAFFGSSLLSAYWNGAATYYRGILKELAARGARITFFEPDAYDRQKHRDLEEPPWARVVVYGAEGDAELLRALEEARRADMVIKASGVGVFDEFLEAEISGFGRFGPLTAFWDVDAPATLDRLERDPGDPFASLIPKFHFIFTYGGGDPVVTGYRRWGARMCAPIYNALDPATHYRVPPDSRFPADLAFLGNRLPDREARVQSFFIDAAHRESRRAFLLGGSGWHDKPLPSNVRYAGHVGTNDHNAFNSTPRAVLNISRESMARYGYSPATRVFEAAGAGACLITDAWRGIELFLEPGREVLVARDGGEVASITRSLDDARARAIGEAALRRVLAHHTYAGRAAEWEAIVTGNAKSLYARQ